MPRARTISDEQILDAAVDLFFSKGHEATASEIAERAGVSEGTIFKRFSTKDELFCRAVEHRCCPAWIRSLGEERDDLTPRAELEKICHQLIDSFLDMFPRIHLIFSSPPALRKTLMERQRSPGLIALREMTAYIERAQARGRIGAGEAPALARMILGAMHHYAFCERFELNEAMPYPRERYVRQVVGRFVTATDEPRAPACDPCARS